MPNPDSQTDISQANTGQDDRATELAAEAIADGEPLAWFDRLYSEAKSGGAVVPWFKAKANPHLEAWIARQTTEWTGKRALVVGCGLGDDAECLAELGLQVTAFDLSPTAISWCQQRNPDSKVEYVSANLLQLPKAWLGAFDLVFESYTLQAMPIELRAPAIKSVASLPAPNGTLLLICRGREADEPLTQPPWPLTREDIDQFTTEGLNIRRFEDFSGQESPPVRRFGVEMGRA
jgi:SAM-dependent methyltransferase